LRGGGGWGGIGRPAPAAVSRVAPPAALRGLSSGGPGAPPADPAPAGPPAMPLRWDLDVETRDAIEELERDVARRNRGLALRCFDVPSGSRGVKGDLAAQLAIQLAYFELTGEMHSVYQPAHM